MGQPRSRTFGLTYEQREDGLLFMRPGTVNRSDELITPALNIGPPPDGDPVIWWLDASFGGAHFQNPSATDYDLVWRDDPEGLEFDRSGDSNQGFDLFPTAANNNYTYFGQQITGSFTFASLFHVYLDTFPNDSGLYAEGTIFTTAQSGASTGDTAFKVAVTSLSGTTDMSIAATVIHNGDHIWTTGHQVFAPDPNGLDAMWIHQDTSGPINHMEMAVNGRVLYQENGFSLPSPPVTTTRPGIIGNDDFGSVFEGVINSIIIDTYPNRGPAAIDWGRGNDYTPSSVTIGAARTQSKLFSSDGGAEDTASTVDMDT